MKKFYKFFGIFLCVLFAYANYIGWSFTESFRTGGGIGHRSYGRSYHK